MRKTRIYLDTSVISFFHADDAPDFKAVTRDFFENYVRRGLYEAYISEIVAAEIARTRDPLRRHRLLAVLGEYPLSELSGTDESERLASVYIERGVIPPAHVDDARHIAIATCAQMDVLLSWNFKHLANIKKQLAVKIVNEQNGYFYPLLLTNPIEVLYEYDRHD